MGLANYLEFCWHVAFPSMSALLDEWWQGGEVVIRGNPIGNRRGDVAVISPANNEVVVNGELHIAGEWFCGNNQRMTWSCPPFGVGGFVRWLFFGPDIAESRFGKSGQRGGGVLSANFVEVGLESSVLRVGNGASPCMTGLVVAVDKAFSMDVPSGAHEGCFIPLGTIPCAFPYKITLPNLAFFHQELGDGGGVFDNVLPFNFVGLPFFPSLLFAIIPGCGCGCVC